MTQEVFDTIKAGDDAPSDDIRHLVNFWAVRIRATNNRDLISHEQMLQVVADFKAFMDTMGEDNYNRFKECIIVESARLSTGEQPFWKEPADTAIKFMGKGLAAGIGVA